MTDQATVETVRERLARALPTIVERWDSGDIDNVGAADLILAVVADQTSAEGLLKALAAMLDRGGATSLELVEAYDELANQARRLLVADAVVTSLNVRKR